VGRRDSRAGKQRAGEWHGRTSGSGRKAALAGMARNRREVGGRHDSATGGSESEGKAGALRPSQRQMACAVLGKRHACACCSRRPKQPPKHKQTSQWAYTRASVPLSAPGGRSANVYDMCGANVSAAAVFIVSERSLARPVATRLALVSACSPCAQAWLADATWCSTSAMPARLHPHSQRGLGEPSVVMIGKDLDLQLMWHRDCNILDAHTSKNEIPGSGARLKVEDKKFILYGLIGRYTADGFDTASLFKADDDMVCHPYISMSGVLFYDRRLTTLTLGGRMW
jgi:hypothetical protein